MIRYFLDKILLSTKKRYDYDVGYLQEILQADLPAFAKFMGFQTMSAHGGNLPVEPLFAARIRAILWDDCGPCTQLVVNMALEAKVRPDVVRAIIEGQLEELPGEVALVVRFTQYVMAHAPEAEELRAEIVERWGQKGLVAIAFAISSSRVYPALKYAMGYGYACQRIQVDNVALAPKQHPPSSEPLSAWESH